MPGAPVQLDGRLSKLLQLRMLIKSDWISGNHLKSYDHKYLEILHNCKYYQALSLNGENLSHKVVG